MLHCTPTRTHTPPLKPLKNPTKKNSWHQHAVGRLSPKHPFGIDISLLCPGTGAQPFPASHVLRSGVCRCVRVPVPQKPTAQSVRRPGRRRRPRRHSQRPFRRPPVWLRTAACDPRTRRHAAAVAAAQRLDAPAPLQLMCINVKQPRMGPKPAVNSRWGASQHRLTAGCALAPAVLGCAPSLSSSVPSASAAGVPAAHLRLEPSSASRRRHRAAPQ